MSKKSDSQAIKDGMTKGLWKSSSSSVASFTTGTFLGVFQGRGTSLEQDAANSEATVICVNNTIGQNIDPCKVPEMYRMLDSLIEDGKLSPAKRTAIHNLLNSSKLR